ncbi:MAG TPA: thioredoxin domain-containing protein [Pseudomonadota bacterium]|jgi:predicted DsbA family dithiol-disulfide isomerase|nr:thioredoxin domain-containing protein [Deltaproteobacteria bacterium]HPH27554.1 thioredoxin domain-containing protein [Pseudomonadota bacterium]
MKRMTAPLSIATALCLTLFGGGATAAWAADPPKPVAAAPKAAGGSDEIPKLDIGGMLPSELDSLRKLLKKFPSPCGKPHSLLVSLQTDAKCGLSLVAAKYLQKMLADGFLESEAEEKYSARFVNVPCEDINIGDAAVRGDPKAPITIVEFSDFECPHCKMAEPWLKQILKEFPTVRLVFMNFPISAHPNAANAAAATVAAGRMGKFWAYHDKVFENQDHLRLPDLLRYAKELELDVEKFKVLMDDPATRARVARERAVGDKLKLDGTPSFFVNCKRAKSVNSVEALRSYIEAEQAK